MIKINLKNKNYFGQGDFLAEFFLVEHHSGSQHLFHDILHFSRHEKSALSIIIVEERFPGETERLKVAKPDFDASFKRHRATRSRLLKDASTQLYLVRSKITKIN